MKLRVLRTSFDESTGRLYIHRFCPGESRSRFDLEIGAVCLAYDGRLLGFHIVGSDWSSAETLQAPQDGWLLLCTYYLSLQDIYVSSSCM
jgi:hypothetical protein